MTEVTALGAWSELVGLATGAWGSQPNLDTPKRLREYLALRAGPVAQGTVVRRSDAEFLALLTQAYPEAAGRERGTRA